MNLTSPSLALLLLAAGTLQAQAPATPPPAPAKPAALEGFRFGIQGGLVSATTDSTKYLTDKKMGFVVGLQGTVDVLRGQRLRGRLDFTSFPKATVPTLHGGGGPEDDTISAMALGLDYMIFFAGRPEGGYWTGGAALTSWKQDASPGETKTHTSIGLATGLGWQFNRTFGLEGRATWARWQTNFRPSTIHNAGTLSLEASVRF